ncbi:PREDICTED: uncharacterized protein LOC108354638, partial [Rhagoletis zephyria]|uniref:uncharacterized protein LOC108354638 n=1 Tax=Rhagoletis zephyria TaxID=28612 RepID=UPI00081177B1
MLPRRTMEYLIYLGFFILLLKFADAATVPTSEDTISENSIKPPPFSHLTSTDSISRSTSNTKRDAMKRAFAECRTQWSWFCLKIEFVKIMERLAVKDELSIAPGISVVRNVNASEVKSNDLMA